MGERFIIKRRVQFSETDLAGVLHFSNYYRMMEEAEHAFWRSLGMSVFMIDSDQRISWPRVATSCQYFAPVRFEDELELVLRVSNIGERSITYEIEFRCHNRRIALGSATAACCAMVVGSADPTYQAGYTFQPVSIPESVRSKIAPFVSKKDGS